jgi:hypothetical protein
MRGNEVTMATKSIKTSKPRSTKTTAAKTARARKSDAVASAPTHEMIAMRAYELWCTRGFTHGRDVEDWLDAERELCLP